MYRRTIPTSDLFIAVTVCVELATLLREGDKGRTVHQRATDSPEQLFWGFRFRVFSFFRLVTLPKLESPINLTILPIAADSVPNHWYLMTRTYISTLFCFFVFFLDCGGISATLERAAFLWNKDTRTRITWNCSVSGRLSLNIHE